MSADRAEVPGSRAERSTGDAAAEPPRISVVVPTRNRPEHAAACARSILRGDGFEELIFVDQSDEDATDKALSAISDARLRHVRSGLRGVTNGRNVGIDLSRGTVVAFTDDDCRVPPDWAHRIASVFSSDPGAAVVCGRVRVPDEIQERGFAVAFEPQVREWCHQFPPPESDWGITANMAIRREVLEEVGYFDPVLGAGAPLRSGGEPDFLFRVLRAGLKVVNAREVEVEHLGLRTPGSQMTRLARAYALGTAAAFVKHVRLGDLEATRIYLRHLGGCGRLVLINALHLHRPVGVGYALAFLSGTLGSFKYRVDRRRKMYVSP